MKTILRAQGLTCPSCVQKIEKALLGLDGVQDATVHFATGRIEVQHDAGRAGTGDLIKAVRKTGYQATAGRY